MASGCGQLALVGLSDPDVTVEDLWQGSRAHPEDDVREDFGSVCTRTRLARGTRR